MNNIIKKDLLYIIIILAAAYFIFLISEILLPFLMGIFIAYLLDPLVDLLEKKKFNRVFSASFVIIIFFLMLICVSILILPILTFQIKDFLQKFPDLLYLTEEKLNELIFYIKSNFINLPKIEIIKNLDNNFSKSKIKNIPSFFFEDLILIKKGIYIKN